MNRYIVDSRVGCVAVVDTKTFEGVCLTADMPGVVAWWEGVRGVNGWEVPAWTEKKAQELCTLLNATGAVAEV